MKSSYKTVRVIVWKNGLQSTKTVLREDPCIHLTCSSCLIKVPLLNTPPHLPLEHPNSPSRRPYQVSYRWTYKPSTDNYAFINKFEMVWSFFFAERGGSVVMHETCIRKDPGSNPGADQPDWGFFVFFLSHEGKCWVGFSLPRSIWPLFNKLYQKIKSVNLTNETLAIQQ